MENVEGEPFPHPVTQALRVVRATNRGHPPESNWVKLRLLCGDYEKVIEQLK
jgi:hypothetical protein